MRTAIKVPVIESERGWGQMVDDHMVCLSVSDALAFVEEFNSKNNEPVVPDWYMYAESATNFIPVDLNNEQTKFIKENDGRAWWSQVRKLG